MARFRPRKWQWTIVLLLFVSLCVWQRPLLPLLVFGQVFIEVRSEVPSPDGKYVALAYVTNGGVTTSFETWVNLREGRGWFGIGSLRFGIGEDAWVFNANHSQPGQVVWLDDRTLLIEYGANDRLFVSAQAESWKDVRIIYRRIEREPTGMMIRSSDFITPTVVP